MPFPLHLEKLTSGMQAKLDTRYRSRNSILALSQVYRSGLGKNTLGDAVGKNRGTSLKISR